MPNEKVSAMSALAGASIDTADLFEIIDVSDVTDAPTGTNKKTTAGDLALAVKTLESLISTSDLSGSYIPLSTVTTKGDLIVATASAVVAREPVGADDYIYMADSSQTTGHKWAAPETTPSTQAFGDSATEGSSDTYSRGGHKHAMPTNADVNAAPATINAQTGTTYTLALVDAGAVVTLSNGSAITLTVPTNASVAFPIGTTIELVAIGAGQVTVSAAGGVTLNKRVGAKLTGQYSVGKLRKYLTDTWVLWGDLSA